MGHRVLPAGDRRRGRQAAAEAKRPNVLFLITDDQFKDMMNWLPEGKGKNLTPNTDRLAAEGTVMLRQYVTSPVCTPSRYACLTVPCGCCCPV